MIPVIDISSAVAGSADDRVVEQVRHAITDVGFFQVVGHGVPAGLIDAAYRAGRDFFAMDDDVKRMVADPHPFRGWSRPVTGARPVQQRFQFCNVESAEDARSRGIAETFFDYFTPNRWPEQIDLRAALWPYVSALQPVAGAIMSLFARVLDLDPGFFDQHLVHQVSCFAVNHYEGAARDGDDITALVEHRDSGTLTVLHQRGDYAGLRVMLRDGTRMLVPVREDAFVINIGELMARWTNDRFYATPHGVILPEDARAKRTSLTLFHLPSVDVEIAPLPSTVGAEGPRYEPITPYLWERQFLARSYGEDWRADG